MNSPIIKANCQRCKEKNVDCHVFHNPQTKYICFYCEKWIHRTVFVGILDYNHIYRCTKLLCEKCNNIIKVSHNMNDERMILAIASEQNHLDFISKQKQEIEKNKEEFIRDGMYEHLLNACKDMYTNYV